MKLIKNFSGLMILMILTMIFSTFTGANPAIVGGSLFAASQIKKPQGALLMALDVEIWKPWIVEQLFANNEFLNYAANADEHVINGKIVHIPNAGSASRSKKNRSVLPATVTRRKDIDVVYMLDEYTSDPRLLESVDKILSYDKMNSAMGQDLRTLKQMVAEGMLYNWRPDITKIIETSGSARATHLTSTTGNRKTFQLIDLEEAGAIMDDDDVPAEDRYSLMSSRMHQQLVDQLSPRDAKDFSRAYDERKNIIGELFGFKFLKRSKVLRADDAKVFYDPDPEIFVPGNTDCDSVLCWHIDAVERAIGTSEVFESLNDPTYYGDVYSLLIRAGGRRKRADNKGVISIVQKNS
jgi:hypothetical protein